MDNLEGPLIIIYIRRDGPTIIAPYFMCELHLSTHATLFCSFMQRLFQSVMNHLNWRLTICLGCKSYLLLYVNLLAFCLLDLFCSDVLWNMVCMFSRPFECLSQSFFVCVCILRSLCFEVPNRLVCTSSHSRSTEVTCRPVLITICFPSDSLWIHFPWVQIWLLARVSLCQLDQ